MIKLRNLIKGDYPRFYLDEPNVITKVLKTGKDRRRISEGVMREERSKWCGHKPKNLGSYQTLEKTRKRFSGSASRRSTIMLKPWFCPVI